MSVLISALMKGIEAMDVFLKSDEKKGEDRFQGEGSIAFIFILFRRFNKIKEVTHMNMAPQTMCVYVCL
jgi:hypothetical protein